MISLQAPVICEVCQESLWINWTDTPGVGTCKRCLAPFLVYVYDELGNPMHKWPEVALTVEGLAFAREVWNSGNRAAWPHLFDEDYFRFTIGFPDKRLLLRELINMKAIQAMQGRNCRNKMKK